MRRILPRTKVAVPEAKKPVRKEPAVVAAMVTGICAVTAAGVGFIGVQVAAKISVKPPEQPSCIVVLKDYQATLKDNPAVLDVLVHGGNSGASVLSSDPNAKRCNITADVLAKLARK
ncbi:hypothetical protein AB0M48_08075 [Lentzea sp. NPDC051208]|uniref:hypothetical protein n=1 Tax=Lentzea sp. NPDC051208 TaxID=3154642 RepID=UPI0034444C2D